MPGCSVSLTTEIFCSVVNRRRRATPVMTSTFENVSDIGVRLGLCLAPPANAGVRSKRGAVHLATSDDVAWQKAIEQNFMYVARMCRGVLPHMQKAGGSIFQNTAILAIPPLPRFGLSRGGA